MKAEHKAVDVVSVLSFVAGVLLIVFAVTMGSGCSARLHKLPPIDSAPVIASQEGKDRAILSEAAQIDRIAPQAKPHTDAQRAAVAAAPAADVAAIIARYEVQAKADAAIIAKLTKDLASAKDATDRVIRLGGYAFAGILAALAAASLFLAAQVPWLGPRISAALGAAAVSIFAMVQAYEWTKAHPWITGIALLCLVVAAVLAYANHFHARTAPATA